LADRFNAEDAQAGLNAAADLASKDRAAPEYVNPNLGAMRSGGTKQYTFNGQPLLRPYAHGGAKDTSQPRKEIGRGKTHAVLAKHNTQSRVLAKVPYRAVTDTDLQQARTDGRVMDELAQLLLSGGDETTRRMSQHFAIELLKDIQQADVLYAGGGWVHARGLLRQAGPASQRPAIGGGPRQGQGAVERRRMAVRQGLRAR
jgi:hypothetical protein